MNPGGVHHRRHEGKRHLLHLARPQDRSGSPTKGAPSPRTINPTGEPVAWVGKTPLRPLARPQDRSGSPTKGAKLTGGNLPDCRLRAPSSLTTTHVPKLKISEP
ncbi:MAG: hypothetical protein ACHBN1_14605 [Heteroscytonema crispum UTEX LB 1556]